MQENVQANEQENGQANTTEAPEPMQTVEKPEPKEEAVPIQVKTPESRLSRSVRRGMRWLLGFLVVFGLGAMLVVFTLYIPARREIQQANQDYIELQDQYKAVLEQIEQQRSEIERRTSSLTELEMLNQSLSEQLDMTRLHVVILSARADVTQARLALAKGDPSRAQIALNKTLDTLEALEKMLKPEQRDTIVDMQGRLANVQKEIGGTSNIAQLELDMLATGLLELENAYFSTP